MSNNIIPEIVIKPELKNIRITVTPTRITFKFNAKELRDKYLKQCKLFAREAEKLKCPVSLRGKYYPESGYDKDINTVVFLTSRRRQGKHCPEKYTVKI